MSDVPTTTRDEVLEDVVAQYQSGELVCPCGQGCDVTEFFYRVPCKLCNWHHGDFDDCEVYDDPDA